MKTNEASRRQECKALPQAAVPGQAQPFSESLTRQFECQFPDKGCPLFQVFQLAAKHKTDPSKCQQSVVALLTASRSRQLSAVSTQESRNKARQWPMHDIDADMADVLSELILQEPISICSQADNCLIVIPALLRGKDFVYAHSCGASVSVVNSNVAPLAQNAKQEMKKD